MNAKVKGDISIELTVAPLNAYVKSKVRHRRMIGDGFAKNLVYTGVAGLSTIRQRRLVLAVGIFLIICIDAINVYIYL